MCILCVIQKWSRRVATMLPWLVIPLIGLWALSQLLPPAFRFEITSPRLACVLVLLITLFWYEILMPQLSAWQLRRNAMLRERKRSEAIELQKLRKTATRRCRNCLTPYRDQNPGGGKFMCSYCGHISKRPVLDLPVPPGLGMSNSRIIKDLVGKGGRILNGKAWSDNGWICSQDWLEHGNWSSGSIAEKSSYWRKNGSGMFGGDENCLTEKSYSGFAIFACKLLTSFFLSIRWIWRKIFRISSSEDSSSDSDHRGMLTKRGENGYNESRGDKARRKAEEKRQARLERELLEEEERKQREEVARLVEERRRLRDEKMEAEKDRSKSSPSTREKDRKKEAEKKRQERRKEKDKGSSKSNSDVEELEKKSGKEGERKREFDKKSETERREHYNSGTDNLNGHGLKHSSTSYGRGNAGTRYLDKMRGTFLSSSRAFTGNGFFGKTVNTSNVTKENKFNSSVDHGRSSGHRRDGYPTECGAGKSHMNGDDNNVNRHVLSEPQPSLAPKKSWQQLFTRSNSNVISRPNPKPQTEAQSPRVQPSTVQSFDNPISFGLPSPFILSNVSTSTSLGFSPPIYPHGAEGPRDVITEEPELFEDPCYVPDPISLLGPVSESLDNFQLDLGMGFTSDVGVERPHVLKNITASPEVSKPSPFESRLSRLRIGDEKHNGSIRFPTAPKDHDMQHMSIDLNDNRTWQMWESAPLGQDSIGLIGSTGSWLLPPYLGGTTNENVLQHSSQKTMDSFFTSDDQILSGTRSPQKVFLSNGQNCGAFSPVTGSNENDPWLQNTFYSPMSGSDNHFPVLSREEITQNEVVYGSPTGAVSNHSFEMSPANSWSKKDWSVQGSGEGVGKSSVARPNIGGLFPADVQSLWSFDMKEKS